MANTPLTVIGLMSGTSVDSIDAAAVRIAIQPGEKLTLSQCDVLGMHTIDLPAALRQRLLEAMALPNFPLQSLCELNRDMGWQFAEASLGLMVQLKAQQLKVDLIASHGQTMYHLPPKESQLGSTLQIGDPALIAERTGLPVAADFRLGDMAAFGQGAPLVPFADQLLFQHDTQARAVQNIGGIANLTALPAINDTHTALLAFDTGPGNMIIDGWTQHFFQHPYDANGDLARQGQVHQPLLNALLADKYFMQLPPKSTGREYFGQAYQAALREQWQDQVLPLDMLATATQFTAITIVEAYMRFVLPTIPVKEVIIGGGGVYNATLMQQLQARFALYGIALKRHEDFGIDSKYKEAIAFALLGYARWMKLPGNIPSCTGAKRPKVLGGLWLP